MLACFYLIVLLCPLVVILLGVTAVRFGFRDKGMEGAVDAACLHGGGVLWSFVGAVALNSPFFRECPVGFLLFVLWELAAFVPWGAMCRQKKGRIVTIASVSGVMGNRGQVNYSASKAGIIGATKALAVELAKRKITVNCIAPGVIETEMIKDAPLDMILPTIPMQRAGKPEEIASAAIFLLSEGASYITRQVINVNGGII